MKFKIEFKKEELCGDLTILSAFTKKGEKEELKLITAHWNKELLGDFQNVKESKKFKGGKGGHFFFNCSMGDKYLVIGLGEKSKLTAEILRCEIAKVIKEIEKCETVAINLDHFVLGSDYEKSAGIITEAIAMSGYHFDKHKSKKTDVQTKLITLFAEDKKAKAAAIESTISQTLVVTDAINYARDLINEAPNILHSEFYAKEIEKDAKKLSHVKCKVLTKKEIIKENMNLLLAVNAGSQYEPRVVHLTYTPKKVTSKTKHIALVGKGLTFDTGGYWLKPSTSMTNMKFDMAGSATVYAAFKAAVELHADVKISCYLGITDNAVSSTATFPDSIIKARNGKSVEIINTDAEGRLVLADVLDYACEDKPDLIIDAATLTGAVIVALGSQVCGIMGNNQKLADAILKSAKAVDEKAWQLPIVDEWKDSLKSPVADLKNIGDVGKAGASVAGAFLSYFIKNDIPWVHLDIAGVGDSQNHLPYCPSKGASGIMIRTILNFIQSNG